MTSAAGITAARSGGPGLTLASAAGRWVLAARVLGSAVAAIDATVVGIALPAIGAEFGIGLAALQWVVTAYTLTLAGLLLVAGALGDRLGRRRVFTVGVIWFAAASLLCGIAPNAPSLIAARALQGVGGALLTPGSLAILQATFTPDDRGRAIGAWSGLGGAATAIGPFLGGWLVQAASWRDGGSGPQPRAVGWPSGPEASWTGIGPGRHAGRRVRQGRWVAASYCSTTLAGIRPRSLTAMPWSFAHARIPPLRSRLDAVCPGLRRDPRPALRACSMNGASLRRNAAAFFLLRSIS